MERVMWSTTFWLNGHRLVWLVAFCHCVVSFQGEGTLNVHNQRKTVEGFMGTPLILTCNLTYEYEFCRYVEVGWHQNSSGLADPSRYLTTVNETILDNRNRLRQVTTKILSLIHEDNGSYQCLAECESKEQSRGHFVEVIVKDRSHR